jgi:hypothetical protein
MVKRIGKKMRSGKTIEDHTKKKNGNRQEKKMTFL